MKEIYYNGIIAPGKGNDAEALAVENGRIVMTGTNEEIKAWADGETLYHDLEGRFVVPGFIDSHMHILNYGKTLRLADLSKAGSFKELLEILGCYRDQTAAGSRGEQSVNWIVGNGWNHDYFQDEKRFPTRADLDQVSKDRPVLAIRACGHIACANSAALSLAGIKKGTKQPEGGCFDVDENGEPTGVFREYGVDLISSAMPVPDKEEIKECLIAAMKELNRFGITSAHSDDLAAFPGVPYETVLKAYQDLEEEGRMTVKVYEQCLLSNLDLLKDFVEKGYRTGVGSAWFRIGPLKILSDGSLGARTAYLSQPYADDADSSNCGIAIYSKEELDELVYYGHSHGMQTAIHAIGDGAMEMAIGAIENAVKKNPRRNCRHGIVHCQITTPELLRKFKELDLHAYIQSIFLDYDSHIVESRVGEERAVHTYQFKTLLDMGVSVSNGSDCPVELPCVLNGIQCAVTRASLDGEKTFLKDQALTAEEAIKTYTVKGAEASFEEGEKGMLLPGMAADFTVLDRDIRKCLPEEIGMAKVCKTFVNGIKVFSA